MGCFWNLNWISNWTSAKKFDAKRSESSSKSSWVWSKCKSGRANVELTQMNIGVDLFFQLIHDCCDCLGNVLKVRMERLCELLEKHESAENFKKKHFFLKRSTWSSRSHFVAGLRQVRTLETNRSGSFERLKQWTSWTMVHSLDAQCDWWTLGNCRDEHRRVAPNTANSKTFNCNRIVQQNRLALQ